MTTPYSVPDGWESGIFQETREEAGKPVTRPFQWFRRDVPRTAPEAPKPPVAPGATGPVPAVLGASVIDSPGGDHLFPPGTAADDEGVSAGQGTFASSASQRTYGPKRALRRDASGLTSQSPVSALATQPHPLASIPAFAAMRSSTVALVAGFDTEFGNMPDATGRYISSYQFAVPVPASPWLARQLVLAPLELGPRARLTIEGAMEVLVRLGGLTAHELCPYVESGVPHEFGRVWAWHDSSGNERTGHVRRGRRRCPHRRRAQRPAQESLHPSWRPGGLPL